MRPSVCWQWEKLIWMADKEGKHTQWIKFNRLKKIRFLLTISMREYVRLHLTQIPTDMKDSGLWPVGEFSAQHFGAPRTMFWCALPFNAEGNDLCPQSNKVAGCQQQIRQTLFPFTVPCDLMVPWWTWESCRKRGDLCPSERSSDPWR